MDPEPPDSLEDELSALLRAAGQGDERSWERLVDMYARRLFALGRSRGLSAEMSEEITQSVFATLATELSKGQYDERGRFESWLFRVAMNRIRDEARRRKRHATPSDPVTFGGLQTEGPSAEPDASVSALRDAIGQLSETDQEIIGLRHQGQMSFKQIAEMLGEPLDRAQPGTGFERRVVAGAVRAAEDVAPAPIRIETRRVVMRPLAGLAAAVLLVGASAALWFGLRPSPGTPPETEGVTQLAMLERDVDDFLALSDMLDEHAGLWGDELRADADTLDESIGKTWDAFEAIADEYDEPAQPRPEATTPQPPEGARQIDRDRLKRRVREARERADRLEAALVRLEAGESLREVMVDLRPDERRYFMPWAPRAEGADRDQPRRPRERDGATSNHQTRRAGDAHPPPDGARDVPPVSPEQVRAFIAEHLPDMDQHLKGIEAENPAAGKLLSERMAPRIGEVIIAQQRDAALGGLKLQELQLSLNTIKIAREAREASRGQDLSESFQQNTRQRLMDQLNAQAETRAKIQRREIELLEERVDALRAELAERESERAHVVDAMVEQMMRRLSRPSRRRQSEDTPDNTPSDD
eukprot:g5887.t1